MEPQAARSAWCGTRCGTLAAVAQVPHRARLPVPVHVDVDVDGSVTALAVSPAGKADQEHQHDRRDAEPDLGAIAHQRSPSCMGACPGGQGSESGSHGGGNGPGAGTDRGGVPYPGGAARLAARLAALVGTDGTGGRGDGPGVFGPFALELSRPSSGSGWSPDGPRTRETATSRIPARPPSAIGGANHHQPFPAHLVRPQMNKMMVKVHAPMKPTLTTYRQPARRGVTTR